MPSALATTRRRSSRWPSKQPGQWQPWEYSGLTELNVQAFPRLSDCLMVDKNLAASMRSWRKAARWPGFWVYRSRQCSLSTSDTESW